MKIDENKVSDIKLLQSMPNNFGSFKSIQEVFAYCYFDNFDVDVKFEKIIKNEGDKFYRYNFFVKFVIRSISF